MLWRRRLLAVSRRTSKSNGWYEHVTQSECLCTQVLAQEGINPAGEVDEMMSGAHVDIQKLVEFLVTNVQSTTPIGKRFERLQVACHVVALTKPGIAQTKPVTK